MRQALGAIALAAMAASGMARADVVQSGATGFEISHTITIDAPAEAVWAALRSPQKWWDKEHTYSGDSANLYLDAQATGCFCEKLPGKGSIEHAHVVYVEPGRALRLHGALGPLQAEGATGALTFTLQPEGERVTKVKLSYVVGGFVRGGMEALAPKVDEVLGIQLGRLKAIAEAPPAAEPAQP